MRTTENQETEPAKAYSPYLNKPDAAQRLKVSTRTLEIWMAKRLVPFSKIGRTVRFNVKELDAHVSTKLRVV